jgi:MSHA biogenesis protein MshP
MRKLILSLVKQLDSPLSQQAGKWLVIPRRRESSGSKSPRSGQNQLAVSLREGHSINWIPVCAGMTGRGLQRGFSLVSAIFLLVVIAAMGAFAVTLSTNQHQSDAMDVMGKRTYQAARAGIEWGAFQIIQSAAAGTNFALACQAANYPSSVILIGTTFSNYLPVDVNCSSTSAVDASTVWIYTLTASAATNATAGGPDYFERQLSVTIAQ